MVTYDEAYWYDQEAKAVFSMGAERIREMARRPAIVEELCEVMHDAYEAAATGAGWETQTASRKPWADVPETNKVTMRATIPVMLNRLADLLEQP